MPEKLQRVLMVPYKNFKEKINLVKNFLEIGRVQIIDDYIYLEYFEEE